jgi:hypothetical protein
MKRTSNSETNLVSIERAKKDIFQYMKRRTQLETWLKKMEDFGFPIELGWLENTIFHELPPDLSAKWPRDLASTIRPKANFSNVLPQFMIWLLEDPVHGVIQYVETEAQEQILHEVVSLVRKRSINQDDWQSAYDNAIQAATWIHKKTRKVAEEELGKTEYADTRIAGAAAKCALDVSWYSADAGRQLAWAALDINPIEAMRAAGKSAAMASLEAARAACTTLENIPNPSAFVTQSEKLLELMQGV